MRFAAKRIALGGVLAALGVAIMTIGGLIPFSTYVCPLLCALWLLVVKQFCGGRIGWAWYAAVAILSLLLSPDKEAAAVFLFMGYYPLIQEKLNCLRLRWMIKFLYFNAVSAVLYAALLYVFGMDYLLTEFTQLGLWGFLVTLALGNVCFFMMDMVLFRFSRQWKKRK